MFNSGFFRGQGSSLNSSDSSDDNFIRFHQSPGFSPHHNSTPNRRGNNWRGRNNFSRSQNDSGNSPNFHNRGPHTPYQRKNRSGGNASFSRDDADISLYYSHEMIEDPWFELEEKQRNDEILDAKFDEDSKSSSESASHKSDASSEDEA